MLYRLLFALFLPIVGALAPLNAIAESGRIGIVLMHGKGGTPTKHISDLAGPLEQQGYLVANLEMPWSGRRNYDVPVKAAEAEIEAALGSLRSKGAQKVFVAGLSQGGLFALHFGTGHAVDGIIAITPGGSVGSNIFREKLGESVESARKLVAEGKGEETARLFDFESSKGIYPIVTRPSVYLTWFDPEGAMNQAKAAQAMNPAIPVLFIVPTRDYPGLLKIKQKMFDALPKNPRTKLYEPDATHLGSPAASIKEIIDWTSAVANAR
jgi:pimeloyl-ACP methyl ester carboxylesterase